MKERRLHSSLAFALVAALALAPQPSKALFYAASRAVRSADAQMEKGRQAEEEGRRLDAKTDYEAAYDAYATLRKDHPDVKPEHVAAQMAECRTRLLALYAEEESANESAEAAFHAAHSAIGPGTPAEDLPRNQVRHPVPDAAPSAEPPAHADAKSPAPVSTEPPPSSASLEERVDFYLRGNRAAEAVIELDTIVGSAPAQAPVEHRLLLARSLVASGNYARAIALLDPLAKERPADPAVLTLAAGANLAYGKPFVAVQHLDSLVAKYPQYADAYVNLAYTRFAMDPDANRDEAVLYYKHALAYGAKRDPKLEAELSIQVEP